MLNLLTAIFVESLAAHQKNDEMRQEQENREEQEKASRLIEMTFRALDVKGNGTLDPDAIEQALATFSSPRYALLLARLGLTVCLLYTSPSPRDS